MDSVFIFLQNNIFQLIPIFIAIYLVLYIINFDLLLMISILIFLLYFGYIYYININDTQKMITKKEVESFDNKLPSIINKYDDIVKFLYYISDFKQYNEQIYDNLIININDFLTLIEDYPILNNEGKRKQSQDIMFDVKLKILDGFSSFIYSFNNSPILESKLNESVEKLNNILNNYLIKLDIHIDNITSFNNLDYTINNYL